MKILNKIYTSSIQVKLLNVINYLIVLYAFFLPLSYYVNKNIFFIILILLFFIKDIKERLKITLQNKVIQAIIILYSIHILWLIGTQDFHTAFVKIGSVKLLLYAIIFVSLIENKFKYTIIYALLAAIMLSEITSYLIFFQIINPINNATIIDPVPFMVSHTVYTIFLAIGVGIIIFNILNHKSKNKILFFLQIFFLITITMNIFIISSRLGYILYFSVLFFIVLYNIRKNLIKVLITLTLISSILFSFAYTQINNFHNRIDLMGSSLIKAINNQDYTSSFGVRIGLHKYSFDLIKEYPLFGVGTGDHLQEVEKIVKHSKDKDNKLLTNIFHAGSGGGLHSDYLDFTVQFGIIGFLAFLNIFYQLYKQKQNDIYLRNIQILLIIVFLINAIPSQMVYLGSLNQLFIVLLSVTLVPSTRKGPNAL